MNCWNTLRAHRHHNVAGNGKRDGSKSRGIGQSAAKGSRSLFEIGNTLKVTFAYFCILWTVGSASAWSDAVLEFKTQAGLFPLRLEVGEYYANELGRRPVSPNYFAGDPTGWKRSRLLHIATSDFDKKVNRFAFAHRNFDDSAVLHADRASRSFELLNPKTTFSIHQTGNVGFVSLFHSQSPGSTFNDHPEREYTASYRLWKRVATSFMEVEDMVSSAMRVAAVSKTDGIGVATDAKAKPYGSTDDYYAISHPSTYRTFKNDLESIHQNTPEGFQLIMYGEVGRYESIRFVEQTFIPKGGAGDSTTFNALTGTADAWDNAKSSWAYFFGGDTVTEAICIPEEIRGKLPGDYGRSHGIAWYYLGGFSIVHSDIANARICKWDSDA